MEHMSNIFSTSFGINFAKLTRGWLALISLTAKINDLLFLSHPVYPNVTIFYISQHGVATYLKCGEKMTTMSLKSFAESKSVYIK